MIFASGRLANAMSDGVQEVCLAEADAPIDEERVVAAARLVGDVRTGRVDKLVGGPDDEGVEGVLGDEGPAELGAGGSGDVAQGGDTGQGRRRRFWARRGFGRF